MLQGAETLPVVNDKEKQRERPLQMGIVELNMRQKPRKREL